MSTSTSFQSRAAERTVNPGNDASCAGCGEPVKFKARCAAIQVIANVYVDGAWNRVEHYHRLCYDESGQPYGEPVPVPPRRDGSPVGSAHGRLDPRASAPSPAP